MKSGLVFCGIASLTLVVAGPPRKSARAAAGRDAPVKPQLEANKVESRRMSQLPDALRGTWEVEHVAVDLADQMHWAMRPDSPQLLFRQLVVEPGHVEFNGSDLACKQTFWKPNRITWAELFGRGFIRSTKAKPAPNDFGVTVFKAALTSAYALCPGSAQAGATFARETWIALLDPDRLAMHSTLRSCSCSEDVNLTPGHEHRSTAPRRLHRPKKPSAIASSWLDGIEASKWPGGRHWRDAARWSRDYGPSRKTGCTSATHAGPTGTA